MLAPHRLQLLRMSALCGARPLRAAASLLTPHKATLAHSSTVAGRHKRCTFLSASLDMREHLCRGQQPSWQLPAPASTASAEAARRQLRPPQQCLQ